MTFNSKVTIVQLLCYSESMNILVMPATPVQLKSYIKIKYIFLYIENSFHNDF